MINSLITLYKQCIYRGIPARAIVNYLGITIQMLSYTAYKTIQWLQTIKIYIPGNIGLEMTCDVMLLPPIIKN